MNSHATLTAGAGIATKGAARSETLTAAVFAALLGAFLVWGVGFSHISAVHNAAHDVRHSSGFPCH
jgi:cobalt transporter subunit CbtB